MIPKTVLVMAVALQNKFSFSIKFSINLVGMPKIHTHALSTLKKHTTESFGKIFVERCKIKALTGACYRLLCSYTLVQICVSAMSQYNHNCLLWVLDYENALICRHSSS